MKRFETYGEGIPGVPLDDLSGWLIVVEGPDGVGRTTHINRLRAHLEKLGYAVAETGLSRSDLASRGIHRAKLGNTLGSNAFNLFYATDFADRLQQQIVPALRSGFVMLTDRYVYSLIARAIVRGADPDWIKQVYSFALRPDAVFYLRMAVEPLAQRVLADGPFDYWESGMDLPMGEDLYDSFINYQRRVITELDGLAREYGFQTLDATQHVDTISEELCNQVTRLLNQPRPAPTP